MLVDNAIVVVENIYRHMELGKPRIQAAIDGTKEVAMAVAASTATTVAAFFPMVFWGGIMGEFMGFLPKTVIIVLTASLLVAVIVLPVAASRMMPRPRVRREAEDEDALPEQPGLFMRGYMAVLKASIRFRYASLCLGVVSFFGTIAVYAVFNHGTEFFPEVEPDRMTIMVRAPDGTNLETTDRIIRRVEGMLAAESDVDVFVAESGVGGGGRALLGTQAASNAGRLTVDFYPHWTMADRGERYREGNTFDLVEKLRTELKEIPGAEITISLQDMGPPVGSDIEVKVIGEDFHAVGEYAQVLQRELAQIDGVTGISDDYRVGRPEMALRIDRGAAKEVGVNSAVIGNTVRTAVAGTTATTIREGEHEYDVVVRLDPRYRDNLQSVLDLEVPGRTDTSPDTFPVPMSTVATAELAGGTGSLRHIDQDLVVRIAADVESGYNVNAVQAEVAELLETVQTPEGIYLDLAGSDDEQEESAAFLLRAMAIACVLILIVLVTQFDSLAMPVIIMTSVVLSLIGVLWGLLLTGTPFGVIMTGIGVISLAGVVVNNAIVLLDYVQQLRRKGVPVNDALMKAGVTRFRPVVLTAITTVLGLVPMAIGLTLEVSIAWFGAIPVPIPRVLVGTASALWWGPMAVAVIFGLSFATILTLVMVPTMYSIYADFSSWLNKDRRKKRPKVPKAATTAAKVLALGLAGLTGLALAWPAQAVTLEEAFQAAELNNVDLRMVQEQTIQASTLPYQAGSVLSPRIIASGSVNFNQYETSFDSSEMIPEEFKDFVETSPEPIVIQPKQYLQGSVTISQNLFSAPAFRCSSGRRSWREQRSTTRQANAAGSAPVWPGASTGSPPRARQSGSPRAP